MLRESKQKKVFEEGDTNINKLIQANRNEPRRRLAGGGEGTNSKDRKGNGHPFYLKGHHRQAKNQ